MVDIKRIANEAYDSRIVLVSEPCSIDYTPVEYSFSISDEPEIQHVFGLINASLQYNFWFGTSEHRLDSIDSTWITKMLEKEFNLLQITNTNEIYRLKEPIIDRLMNSNITLLDERINSVNEVFSLDLPIYGRYYNDVERSLEIAGTIPSFKKDVFFKKGLLAVSTTARILGHKIDIPVPADYQIPKVLEAMGILIYSGELLEKINADEIILEGSKEELAIRAATILACEDLAVHNNLTPSEVDSWLFSRRKQITTKHHLTMTTNY